MEREELIERLVTECLYDFDFEKVHRVMVATDFTWAQKDGDAVPSVAQLVIEAMRLLRQAAVHLGERKPYDVSYGGLRAQLIGNTMALEFVLEVGWAKVKG